MNKIIEIEFKEDVYCDWELFKRVLKALVKTEVIGKKGSFSYIGQVGIVELI